MGFSLRQSNMANGKAPINRQLFHKTIFKGSLEVKRPTRWTDEKQRWEEAERREE